MREYLLVYAMIVWFHIFTNSSASFGKIIAGFRQYSYFGSVVRGSHDHIILLQVSEYLPVFLPLDIM
jgi:hypothetical protein